MDDAKQLYLSWHDVEKVVLCKATIFGGMTCALIAKE